MIALDGMRQLMISGYARTQIRLRAALCLLKLAQVRAFDRKMTRFLEPISYVMQVGQLDACMDTVNGRTHAIKSVTVC